MARAADNNVFNLVPYGRLRQSPDQLSSSIVLRDGSLVEFGADGVEKRRVYFEQYQWQLDSKNEPFRARGQDERELTP